MWVFWYSEIHSSRWWFTEVVGVVNNVAGATKIEVGWVKELKVTLILVVGKWKCVLIDKVGVSQKRFHVLGIFDHLAFFLMLGPQEIENFSMFRCFFFRVGMLSIHYAACCKGCIFVSEGCCSFHFYVDFCVNIFFVPRGKSSVSNSGCFVVFSFFKFFCYWDFFFILGVPHSRVRGSPMWGLKALKVKGEGLGCVAVDIWLHILVILFYPTLTGRRNALPKESPKRNIQKREDRKKIRNVNISSILSFIYWVKGLTDATSQDVGVVPKTPDSKMVLLVRLTPPERERWYRLLFSRGKSFFLFTYALSPIPLETSGSFIKFNSFLFNLFIYFF